MGIKGFVLDGESGSPIDKAEIWVQNVTKKDGDIIKHAISSSELLAVCKQIEFCM